MKILIANREDLNSTVINICARTQMALLSTVFLPTFVSLSPLLLSDFKET